MSLPDLNRSHSTRQIAFIFLFVSAFIHSYSQQNNFSFNHFSVKDGLSHNFVNAICQDSEGFLWIGTFDGLNRFDGNHFKVFRANRKNPNSLINNIIHDVCTDKEDNIWCLTEGGISRYNKRTDSFNSYVLRDDSSGNPIVSGEGAILCDRQGVIWLSMRGGLGEFIPEKNEFKHYRHYYNDSTTLSANSIRIHSMVEDPVKLGLWLGTNGGLNYFDTKTKIAWHAKNNPEHLPLFDNHSNYPVCITKDNQLVYGDNRLHELCFYDLGTHKVSRDKRKDGRTGNQFYDEICTIQCDSKNNLWIGTWTYKVFFLDRTHDKITELIHDDLNPKSIGSTFCWDVFEDKEGTFWIAGVNGFSYFNPEKINYELYRPDLQFPLLKVNPLIDCLYEDSTKLLWFGTAGAGLFSYDFSTNQYTNYSFEKNSGQKTDYRNTVYSIEATGNEWWLGTNSGIWIFNPVTKTFKKFEGIPRKEEADEYTFYLTRESDRAIWFGTFISVYRYDLKTKEYQSWKEVVIDGVKLAMSQVNSICTDSKNRIWITPYKNGVLQYIPEKNNFKLFPVNDADTNRFPSSPISKLKEDHSGNLWATVQSHGISRLNPGTGVVKTWSAADGLVADICGDMAFDHSGKLWTTSYNLVSVFDPVINQFENFTVEFAEGDYKYANHMLTLSNGKIVSGMLGAFIVLDPEKQSKKIPPQKVSISKVSIFGKEVPFTTLNPNLSLSYKQNFFSFDYSVCTGADRNNIQYSYMLEGFDEDWVEAGNRQYAAYTNVPGGNYVFKVRAKSGNGSWTNNASVINIAISKIYYQTWWFRFLVALCMFFIIRLYVRFRNSRQKKAEAEQAIAYFANSEYTNHNADEIVWDLARNCISRLGFVDCVIYLTDEERNVLVQKAALGNKSEDEKIILNPIEIPVGKGIVGSVASSGKTELIEDTSKDSRYITDDASRFSELAVPILNDGKVIGVIDSEHPRKNFFNDEHKRILETIASICSVKIVNAQAAQLLAENEKKLLEVDKRVAEVRLMALRAQMNPHFIFNCMNTIDNFILKNKSDDASLYLNKFAKLIRSILTGSDKKYVSLKSEMSMLNNYIELENLRFEEKFEYTFSMDHSANIEEIEIPPMLIQPYVENAIIHGLANKKGRRFLSLELSFEKNFLVCIITDNGVGREEALRIKNSKTVTHESKGMRITETRFELLQQQMFESGNVITTDLKDDRGNASGTCIKIFIPIEID